MSEQILVFLFTVGMFAFGFACGYSIRGDDNKNR